MDKTAGGELMLMGETAMVDTTAQISKTQPEPSVAEQIEQIREILNWLYEVRDTMDEEIWLNLVASLEEMLKDLEGSQQG